MSKLQFQGEHTLEELFIRYRWDIYNNIIQSIKSNYKDLSVNQVEVVELSTSDGKPPTIIVLNRNKFAEWLNKCIEFFEELEEYEKCQECVNILNDMTDEKITA
jgi:hypothetical protein